VIVGAAAAETAKNNNTKTDMMNDFILYIQWIKIKRLKGLWII